MSTVSIIRSLAATSSRTAKEQILLDAWMQGERNLFTGAKMAYDILLSFGVKKVAEITMDGSSAAGTFSFADFLVLADKLATRQLTGNAARDAIHDAANNCDTDMWNEFYRRILLKDLRAGVTDSTFNKILGKLAKSDNTADDYMVPVFSCQLAKDGNNESNVKKVSGKKYLDVKLDGVRLLTVMDKEQGTVVQYTRNGKVNGNFTGIIASLTTILPLLPYSLVLDGEITAKNFQELMTQINRKTKVSTDEAKLALFDVIPLKDFSAGKSKMKQKDRHALLCSFMGLFQQHTNDSVYVIPKLLVDLSTTEGQEAFTEFNREAIIAGYEGIMVKDPEAPYECKRTSSWLKMKPFIEVSLTIYGAEEGTGKNVGKLGAWLMRGVDDGKKIDVNVGGGFTDEERADFWARREELMGFIGEVRGDALSLERNSVDVWSIRFPRWKGFRGTVRGEKL